MSERKKSRWDLLQNIAIVLLSASAVTLFAQTQLYTLHPEGGYLSSLFSSAPVQNTPSITSLMDLSAPVRIAATGAYGRYAELAISTGDSGFSELGTLLMEALGSAEIPTACSEEDFRAALGSSADYGNSLYFDFGEALPLSILSGLVGAAWTGGSVSARQILLQVEDGVVCLYLWDGKRQCSVSATALPAAALTSAVNSYQLGSAFFAFDQQETYDYLSPYSLLTSQFSPLRSLSVSSAIPDPSALMTALSFNPHTNSRYTESSGAEVVVEGDRTLRIRPDGSIAYQGGSESLHIAAAGEIPTETEAVVGAYQLLTALRAGMQDGARLYLQSIQTSGASTVLRFSYQLDGLPIRFLDGSSAAEVVLNGTAVARLTLQMRHYTAEDAAAPLLPLAQALAIAQAYPGSELGIYYVESGSAATVQWLAE